MADKGWVNEIYGITVEHRLIPRPGGKPLIPIAKTGIWNPHTTEGMGIDAAWAALNAKHAAPHFITGDNGGNFEQDIPGWLCVGLVE